MTCPDLCACLGNPIQHRRKNELQDADVHEVEITQVPHGRGAYRLECSCGWVMFEDTMRAAGRSEFEHVRDES